MTKTPHYPQEAFAPLEHMKPAIRISPFTPERFETLVQTKTTELISDDPTFWLDNAFDQQYYASGRLAIYSCLEHLGLTQTDEVMIITTTQGPYISSCVTNVIELVCRWSRELTTNTKLIMIIHEFGAPCPVEKYEQYLNTDLPILEDCAYALGTRIASQKVGQYGDYALYSLPKYYPVPFGGLLVGKHTLKRDKISNALSNEATDTLRQCINAGYEHLEQWNTQRQENFNFFKKSLAEHNYQPYFDLLDSAVVPGTYVTKVAENFAGEDIKQQMNAAGIESTQYYNQGGFFFPVHQFLTDYEKEYILEHFFKAQLRHPERSVGSEESAD